VVPGGGSSSLRSDEAGIAGFRRSGLAGDGRADVPEPAAEAGREELVAWFVISEAALRTPYGGPKVVRRQSSG